MKTIAILDSGININDDYFKRKVVVSKSFIKDEDEQDQNGHGSLIASTVIENYDKVSIWNYKVLDKNGFSDGHTVFEALLSLKNKNVDVVLMCITLDDGLDNKKIHSICRELFKEGKVLVCSLDNERRISYPAAYNEVWGVSGAILEKKGCMWINTNKKIQVVMDSTPVFRRNNKNAYELFGKCNSFAAAAFCGKLIKHLDTDNLDYSLEKMNDDVKNKYWISRKIYRSKRYPIFHPQNVDAGILNIVKQYTMEYFDLHNKSILERHTMLDEHVGMTYENAYDYICGLEKQLGMNIRSIEKISRDDLYSVYSIGKLFSDLL